MEDPVNPSKIMQVGLGFFASKTVLTANKLGLFTLLGKGALSGKAIQSELSLHQRGLYDFLDALVALGFLQRTGLKDSAQYSNAPDSDLFLDKNKPTYIGGMLEMANNRLYPFWNDLEEGLKTGKPQNELKTGGGSIFEKLYSDPNQLEEFLAAMAGIQMGGFIQFAIKFDFSKYSTLCDMGGAGGYLAAQVALHNSNMQCASFDLPPVKPIASRNINKMGLSERVTAVSGDFFQREFPKADVITMGNILHDWSLAEKKELMRKAYHALPEGGALVAIENIIDDNRSENAFGLFISLNMLIETEAGFDFTGADFKEWAMEIGFKNTSVMHLAGPASAAIAYK